MTVQLFPHDHLDHLIREAARRDPRITHALAYGSFTQGAADRFSDLEYFLYLPDPARLDVPAWVGGVLRDSPFRIRHFFVNDFGTPNFVLDGLLRPELHAETPDRLADLAGWPAAHADPTRMSVKDTDGRLAGALRRLGTRAQPDPAAEAQGILDRLLGWLVFGANVLARGERIRAHELLAWVRGGLLRLVRLADGQTGHWVNPSRLAEWELGSAALERYARTTGPLDRLEIHYAEAWAWTAERAAALGLHVPPDLAHDLSRGLRR